MAEATLTFKREEREGVIPVGTYLSDAAKRFGILFEEKCVPSESLHFCRVSILEGENAITPPTSIESEYFTANPADSSERLACQAKILEPAEIVIMTTKKHEEADKDTPKMSAEEYAKEFKELPLEKKIAELVQLEAMTFSETLTFVMNSPYLIFDKVMDVMAEFGMKKEAEGKNASRPAEHVESDDAKKEESVPPSQSRSEPAQQTSASE